MSTAYLDWLRDLLEEAQVPLDDASRPAIDAALRRLAGLDADAPGERVLAELRRRWLRHGASGRKLLAGLIRGEVYARRDSALRPREGGGYYVTR